MTRKRIRKKQQRDLEKLGPYARQVLEDVGMSHPGIPVLTPEQAAENRRLMIEEQRRLYPQEGKLLPPGVPELFVDVRFSNTDKRPDVEGYAAAAKAVKLWTRMVAAGQPAMVALIGPKGTSKSHLVACAAWELYDKHSIRVPWHPWYEFVDHLRYGRSGYVEEHGVVETSAARVRQEWHDETACVVDELSPTSGTEFDAIEMRKFSMQRYDRRRSVLLTCNWSSLADMIGEPAADRYLQVTLKGPSYRHL